MNYITEINAFYDWAEVNQPRHAEISLWYALMHMANKSGWKTDFSVPISTLMIKTGLSKSSIETARNKLQQKGRIQFRSRAGNQSAVYQIIPFVPNIQSQIGAQTEAQPKAQIGAQPQSQVRAINKQNKTKQEKTKQNCSPSVSPSIQFFEQNIGPAVKPVEKDIRELLSGGMEEALIIKGMQKGLERGITRWNYIKAILRGWKEEGITTLSAWEANNSRSFQRPLNRDTSIDIAAFEGLGLNIPAFPDIEDGG